LISIVFASLVLATTVRPATSMDLTRMDGIANSTSIESSMTRGSPFGRSCALGALQHPDTSMVTAMRAALGPSREM